MQAARDRLVVRAAYPLSDLAATFTDRSALKSKGQLLLTDRDGRVIVPLPTEAEHLQVPPPLVQAMRDCAAFPDGNVLVRGAQGADAGIIAGVRPVPAVGGGCIVARLDYDEALAPLYRIERFFKIASATLISVALVLSLFIARFGEQVQREHEARIGAEAANRSKDEFLATLSHELRTPLTAILGWASILRQYPQNQARVDHAVRVIERNARMESRLIDDLLDVTRIVNGHLQLSVTDVSVVAAVEAAVEAIRPAADSKGVLVTSHVEGAVANVQADLQRLQQIVWNLLANAVRFTPEAGWVNVVVRSDAEGTQIVVSDTGSGISPELLPHVFDRFRQGQSGTMRTHGGLGLGLAIVRDLVELHGGSVTAASPGQDRGATFTVTLPATPSSTAVQTAAATADSTTADLHGKSVLVVEDDADTREVVREILRQAGATVVTSGSVKETRAVIDRFKPDVLISDIGMPDEDGYALMESIRVNEAAGLHLPAIALSAHARPEDVEHALKSGFDVHVPKPIDSPHLLATVAALLRPIAGGSGATGSAPTDPPAKSEGDGRDWSTIRRQG
jgi:signal transduction histidine kinase/ActR/RegA family two-component response regulator